MGFLFDRQRRAVTTACWVWVLALLFASSAANGQISPGELSNAHSSLNGSAHCTDCHDSGKRPPEFKCLSCHRDIRERLESNMGLHPSLVGSDKSGRSCAHCHIEHNGKSFDLIHWDIPIQQFDHGKTGYPLKGGHKSVACRTCHQPARIPKANMGNISIKDKARTYLGLSRKCISCHADAHQGELLSECESCHDELDWKRPVHFDHKRARFNVDGAHEKVPCVKCHVQPDPAKAPARFKNLNFGDCTPCHRDPHAGAFRNACQTCHTSQKAEWKRVNASASFDHSRTRFPLLGRHAGISCDKCHIRGNFAKPIAFTKCTDCHKSDPHRGQFASAPAVHDCDYCHSVSGFKPSTFGVAQHNATGFPLKERHISAPCAKCHIANASGLVTYRIRNFSCVGCHQDVHKSQFAAAPYTNRCDACHTEKEFKSSTFTVARHDDTRFPLSGGHAKVACAKCHKPDLKPVQYRFENQSCTECHSDPHRSESSARTTAPPSYQTSQSCQNCHTLNSWHDLEKYDHSETGFPLDGAHRNISCAKCHQPAGKTGSQNIVFDAAPKHCAGCHDDPHTGQFASRMAVPASDGSPAGCRSCHNTVSWRKLAGFDHSAAAFPLQGAHQTVPCEKCHKSATPEGGARGIDYLKTPVKCSSCHEDIHAGQFSSNADPADCTRCHQAQKWAPSAFNHDTQSSYKLTGAHRNVRCGLCHSESTVKAGKKIIVYKGIPRDCSACHQFDKTRNQP
jgi:hypothetical protein